MAMNIAAEGNLLKLWEFFAWMDRARCDNVTQIREYERITTDFNEMWRKCGLEAKAIDLKPTDIILAHWLTYILDYGMPAEKVWDNAFPIMGYVALRFREGEHWKKRVEEHIRRISRNGRINYEFYIKGAKEAHSFTHRFGGHHRLDKAMAKTLEKLEQEYDRDLFVFMLENSKDMSANTWVKNLAIQLNYLTYSQTKKEELWHKRTWAALRDYLKGQFHKRYVCNALPDYERKYPDYVLERWRRPQHFLDQLELPGDMWNINFYGKIYPRYIEPLMPKSKKKVEAAKAIRILYDDVLNKEANERGLYPEQFDVTFDLAPNCGSQLCHICPLGRNNSSNLCIGDLRKTQNKYCPLLASFCNYFVRCKTKDCPVLEKRAQGLCPQPFRA